MPDLRRLSGSAVIRILEGFRFRRSDPSGQKQTLTIPRHKELDTGTLRAIFRQASRYVPDHELRPHFFAE